MLIEIVANCQISWPYTAINERHPLALNEFARLLYRLRWTEAVVQAYQRDLPTPDTSAVVDHLDVGKLGSANCTPRGGWPAISHCLANPDFGVGYARCCVLLCSARTSRDRSNAER